MWGWLCLSVLLPTSCQALASQPLGGSAAFLTRSTYHEPWSTYRAAARGDTNASVRLLIFCPASAEERAMKLVTANIQHARQQLPHVDVFLNHYDQQKAAWLARKGAWYHQNVAFSAERRGDKLHSMQALIVDGGIDLEAYDFVWALDEDIDLTATDLPRMFAILSASRALIATPAFTQVGEQLLMSYAHQRPDDDCQYRYTKIVEIIMPVMQAASVRHILSADSQTLQQSTPWGIDRVWCSLAAAKLGRPRETACAIIDETPAVHRNWHTHKHSKRLDIMLQGARDSQAIRRLHPDEYVSINNLDSDALTVSCVRHVL